MQSHYEFNIAKNGKHLFATAPRSAVTETEAKRLYAELQAKFPDSEGYSIMTTYWRGEGNTPEWANR